MDRDDFFAQLHNEATPAADELRRLRQLAYEERTIKRVITNCGIRINGWSHLARLCRNATDEKKLHFDWFNAEYGGKFPCRLGGKRIPKMHSIMLHELFKPLKKNKLIRRVSAALADVDIDPLLDRYLFVFPIIRTPFCIHTLDTTGPDIDLQHRAQFQIIVAGKNNKTGRTVIIEPLKNACAAIGHDWFTV